MGSPPIRKATLVAVILYAMYKGYFEALGILRFASDSIGAHWILNGMEMPGYKTVERVINAIMEEEELDRLFKKILKLCVQMGLVGAEREFIDGVKTKANASKHKAMSYGYLNKKIGTGKEALMALFAEFNDILEGVEGLPEEQLQALVPDDARKCTGHC